LLIFLPFDPFLLKGRALWHFLQRHATPTALIRRISDTLPIHFGQSSDGAEKLSDNSPDGCPN
jgi:hypothetical protein